MGEKQLIIAVEGTAAVGPYWKTILSDYLENIIRSFSGKDLIGQKPQALSLQLGLVVFNTHGSYNACLVQRSGWTRDIDIFFQWLSAISFGGGGFNEAAIAEGLSEALMMFCPQKAIQTQQNVEGQKHCILVAASNPYQLPTPVYRPKLLQKMEQTESTEAQSDNRLSDAETIAKYFGLCSVSLSVICPKQLPKLKAIFNAGKQNPQTDPPIDITKNPSFLVLISENLMEGRSALSRPGMQNVAVTQSPVKMDSTAAQPVSGPLSPPIPTGNVSIRPVTVGNIPPATVKVEPPTVTSMAGPVFPHMSSVPRTAAPAVASLQTSSPMSSSKDMMSPPESVQDMKPTVSTMAQTMRPAGPAAANVRILNDVARQALAGSSSIGLQSMGGTPMLSNMISSGMGSSVPAAQSVSASSQSAFTSIPTSMQLSGNVQPSQTSAPASFTSATSNLSQTLNPNMPQTMNNLQNGGNMAQSVPAMNQGTLPSTHMGQSGMNMSQNMLSGIGASGMSSATGSMMATPGMSQPQQTGMQQLGDGNNTTADMSMSQENAAALQSVQSKYVKVWEGNLSGQRQGQPVFITRLEGYRSASASESLAANWPPIMQIVRLISQDHMNNKQYVGKADFLVFRAMNQHGFLGQLQEKKLCAVIQLPSRYCCFCS
ncbi:hypothetical protein Leryth_020607 [Lithospermum erythrorhizon]|nr:hypothetical protein Leryth_020607 [Lithospermum erythrorhizon]